RDFRVTGVQACALPICAGSPTSVYSITMSFTTWRVVPELLASSELHPRAGSSPSVVTPPVAVPPVLAAPPVPVVLLVLVLVLVDDVVEAVTLSVVFEAPPVD